MIKNNNSCPLWGAHLGSGIVLTALYFFFSCPENSLLHWVLLFLFYRKLMFGDLKGLDHGYSVAEELSGEVKTSLLVCLFLHGMLLKT